MDYEKHRRARKDSKKEKRKTSTHTTNFRSLAKFAESVQVMEGFELCLEICWAWKNCRHRAGHLVISPNP